MSESPGRPPSLSQSTWGVPYGVLPGPSQQDDVPRNWSWKSAFRLLNLSTCSCPGYHLGYIHQVRRTIRYYLGLKFYKINQFFLAPATSGSQLRKIYPIDRHFERPQTNPWPSNACSWIACSIGTQHTESGNKRGAILARPTLSTVVWALILMICCRLQLPAETRRLTVSTKIW